MDEIHLERIVDMVYYQLSYFAKEAFYQRAMALELNCQGYVVDLEKSVSCFYNDSKGNQHTISQDRIDLYVHISPSEKIVLELKHADSVKGEFIHQMYRYLHALSDKNEKIQAAYLICFPKSPDRKPFFQKISLEDEKKYCFMV